MRPILFLIPDLQYHGHGRQAALLAPTLPRDRFRVEVFSLQGEGPFTRVFLSSQVPVLGETSRFPLGVANLIELRKRIKNNEPSIIHLWGIEALRALGRASVLRSSMPPLVVSLQSAELRRTQRGWWSDRLLQRVDAFVVGGEAERAAVAAAGLPQSKIHAIPPGISISEPEDTKSDFRAEHQIGPKDCLLMGVGHFDTPDRFLDAIWAFEVIRGTESAIRLLLIGSGRCRDQLRRRHYFASKTGTGFEILDARPDAAALLSHADVVIVGHRHSGGRYAALEGMAAGKPVIAPRLPHLVDLIRDGETGCLVEHADPIDCSRTVLRLMTDEALRKRLGDNSRAAIETIHRVDAMATRFAELYDKLQRPRRVSA